MIWNRDGKIWYQKETIDKIIKVCKEQNLKYDNVACGILNIIEEAENETKFYNFGTHT
jgi:hypothetical protein